MNAPPNRQAATAGDGPGFEQPLTARLIAGGAVAASVGVLLSLAEFTTLSGWLTIGGTVVMMWGLHRYGRRGPA